MSAKSDRKKQRLAELQLQDRARLAALRDERSDGAGGRVFRCDFPTELVNQFPDVAMIDFGNIGARSERRNGTLAIRLPEPYAHLVIEDGEVLTDEKAWKVYQAALALRATPRSSDDVTKAT